MASPTLRAAYADVARLNAERAPAITPALIASVIEHPEAAAALCGRADLDDDARTRILDAWVPYLLATQSPFAYDVGPNRASPLIGLLRATPHCLRATHVERLARLVRPRHAWRAARPGADDDPQVTLGHHVTRREVAAEVLLLWSDCPSALLADAVWALRAGTDWDRHAPGPARTLPAALAVMAMLHPEADVAVWWAVAHHPALPPRRDPMALAVRADGSAPPPPAEAFLEALLHLAEVSLDEAAFVLAHATPRLLARAQLVADDLQPFLGAAHAGVREGAILALGRLAEAEVTDPYPRETRTPAPSSWAARWAAVRSLAGTGLQGVLAWVGGSVVLLLASLALWGTARLAILAVGRLLGQPLPWWTVVVAVGGLGVGVERLARWLVPARSRPFP